MANNIQQGTPYAGTCIKPVSVIVAGFNGINMPGGIFKLGAPPLSWQDGSNSNGFDSFDLAGQYLFMNPGADMDVSEWFSPPFPVSSGSGIVMEDGTTPIIPE